MRDDLLPRLRCPVCAGVLRRTAPGQVGCERGHRFDEARSGHLTLTSGRPSGMTADDAAMIDARVRFLGAGHYAPIADALARAAGEVDAPGLVLDAGAGPGWYLTRVLDACADRLGIALDLSPAAARRAAKAHPRAGAIVADLTRELPIADASVAALLDVFAPRPAAEYHRVLHREGRMLVVTPQATHLSELVDSLGLIRVDPLKQERLDARLSTHFTQVSALDLDWRMTLDADAVHDLVHMGPNHRHAADRPLESATVTASVTLAVYRPR